MLADDDGDEGLDASKNSTQVRPAPRMSQGAQALRYLQRGSNGGDLLQKAAAFAQNAKLVEAQQGKQRKRDRRITRMQRKTLRDKKQALAKVPHVASLKSLRAQEMKAFIQERRVIWEDAKPNRARGSSERIEHPAVNGYALQPVPSQWDPRKQSPIYFGCLEQQKANCTYVEVDLKIFGITLEDWGPKFQVALERTIWTLIPAHFHVPPCAVKLVFTEEVAGENLRRVAEKVERRAQNHQAFREHLANLVREDGGVINVKLHVGIHATAEAIEQCGRYRVPVPEQDDATLARRLMTLDIPSQELLKARKVANDLAQELIKGTIQSTLRSLYSSDKAFSLAHNHIPKPNKSLKSQDYSLPADTPRKRQTNARKLFFNVGKLLATGKPCDAEDDVSEVNHRADFEFTDTSQSRFIHPSFCQRKIAHVRPDPSTVNPIFWGQWSQPQIRDYALRNEKKAPAWNSVQKRVHPSFVCDERDYTLEDTVLHFSFSSRDADSTDAKRRHPMFSGYVRCGPDHNQLDHEAEERRRASEAAEAEDDEAFVASLARRNNRSRRRRHDEEEEMRIKKWIEQTKKRNIHPATRGYRTRLVPLYAKNLAQRLHPSCFGYETAECQVLPTYRVTRVVHPACVGYELVAQEPHTFTSATAKLLNPMFHGLSLRKGPRYEPPIADNDTMTKRRYFLEGLTSNPVKESVPLCVVCFGENSVGCPRCWTPGAWEISGTKLDDLASDITKTIAQSPILNRVGGRARQKIATQNSGIGAHNSSDADTKSGSKKAKRFKLKMAAMTALVDTTRLLSVADIRTYRSTKSSFVTIFIKSLPTGEVTRLTVDATSTVRDLYFLYRSNARRDVALLPRFWLVVPMLSGLMCLDETRQIHDEMNCAFEPGKLTLEEYGLFKKDGEVCLFQIKDLYHPQAATIVRKYIEANVNLARKLDIEEIEEAERQESELPGKRRVRSKFEEDTTSSVSIKTRINAMRVANGRGEAVDGPAGQNTASLLHAEIMKEIHFELLFRPDQLPPPVPGQPYTPSRFNVANDALQLPLVREMRDVMIRQKRAWKEHIVEREEVIKKARDAKLAHALEVRKMAKASSDERGGRRKRTKAKKIPNKPFLGPSVPRSSPGPRQIPRLPILCSRSIVLTDDA